MNLFKKKKKLDMPICIFCYHKVGTVLFSRVFRDFCNAYKLNFQVLLGYQDKIPEGADVVLFGHSLINSENFKVPFKGIHLVRDPRDIIVSGFLYHQRTSEEWTSFDPKEAKAPYIFPQVPYSMQHRDEDFKKQYLDSLNGKSYQEVLKGLNQTEGMTFEINNYGEWTISSMNDWDYNQENIIEFKFETIMTQFDESFKAIFKHLDFSEPETSKALKIAQKHDLKRKSKDEIEKMKHVSSTKTSKWADYFEEEHKTLFKEKFGDVLIKQGYETNNDW